MRRSPRRIPERAFVSMLDAEGQQFDSLGFSEFLEQRRASGRDLCFVIGGAFGGLRAAARRPQALARADHAPPPAGPRSVARADLPRPQDHRRRALPPLGPGLRRWPTATSPRSQQSTSRPARGCPRHDLRTSVLARRRQQQARAQAVRAPARAAPVRCRDGRHRRLDRVLVVERHIACLRLSVDARHRHHLGQPAARRRHGARDDPRLPRDPRDRYALLRPGDSRRVLRLRAAQRHPRPAPHTKR